MIIDSANVGMESARLYKSQTATRVRGGKSVEGNYEQDGHAGLFAGLLPGNGQDEDSKELIENEAPKPTKEEEMEAARARLSTFNPKVDRFDETRNSFKRLHEMMIKEIFRLLFNRKSPCDMKEGLNEAGTEENLPVTEINTGGYFQTVSIAETFQSIYTETESTSFAAEGMVKTSDGRELSFNINVSMSRRFTTYYEENYALSVNKLVDPLVINFDTDAASISDQSFFFDLDTDGEAENISALGKGSGFLALDLNGDGKINDGSELFGTRSGDGFKDLARYDLDRNGWIDENDEIFNCLKIWTKDEEGNDILYSLKDLNIGAMFLEAADTEFAVTDKTEAEASAYIRKTGLFLYESGVAGTMQHVDLVS